MREGRDVILVSSDLAELLRCSDRILVLHNGRQTGIFDAREASQETIMTAATHTDLSVEPLAWSGRASCRDRVWSEVAEVFRCSNRILVLQNGRQTGIFGAGEASQETIMPAATHTDLPAEPLA